MTNKKFKQKFHSNILIAWKKRISAQNMTEYHTANDQFIVGLYSNNFLPGEKTFSVRDMIDEYLANE